MTEDAVTTGYLDLYAGFLGTLGTDMATLAKLVPGTSSRDSRAMVVAALNYVFKSVDLIPDGIDDIGFLDDAFVLRVASELALRSDPSLESIRHLAKESGAIREFLGDDFARLEAYVTGLVRGEARGRNVEDILNDNALQAEFLSEVAAWSQGYEVPPFNKHARTLVKLKAFLSAKLP